MIQSHNLSQQRRSLRRRHDYAVLKLGAMLLVAFALGCTVSLAILTILGGANSSVRQVQSVRAATAMPDSQREALVISRTSATDLWQELIDTMTKEKLTLIAQELKDNYASAQPFPHVVIDGLFPQSILDALLKENPESLVGENGCLPNKALCKHAKEDSYQYHKSAINKEETMGPVTRLVANFFKSGIFIEFLKDLSGIRGLLADPLFDGGGIHFTSNGGKLDIHSDFNKYPGPKLERRVNTFLFLNNDWEDEYGGHLELWSRDMRKCMARISPELGRFVVFTTSDFSYHGHPLPLSAPPGRSRRSMANYYYTVGRPVEDCATPDCKGHSTLWQTPMGCDSCLDPACNALPEALPVYKM